ncbi:nucleosome assembly protein 1;4 [Solanum lycopersicum]|uniref:nucleosome assembly protein 1;4 n=1 Tax=Solanum lycopersicum TaxID=4081 RepID=UPI000276694E|nr:nucleosome assembly protein 1;4 [Solanum lycopersicum]
MSISIKDRSDSDLLPAAAAALSAEDRALLVNALKNKLQNLAMEDADILTTLSPQVRKRVDALRELQGQHDELQAKFLEESAALETKYQKLYEPLYTKRYEIVNGIVEVEGVNVAPLEQGDNQGTGDGTEKGVPNFWLNAMLNNEILAEEISEYDEEALEFLKDIKWCRVNDAKGFKLEFFFDTNPFFKNSVLTKTYLMVDDELPVLDKAIGTDIEWYPGKCLTQKSFKKMQKNGLENVEPVIQVEDYESFFEFFKPPQVPEVDVGFDILDNSLEQLQYQMEHDYEIGSIIRVKVIPHAVALFTGELGEDEDYEVTEYDDEEEKYEKKSNGAQTEEGQQGVHVQQIAEQE